MASKKDEDHVVGGVPVNVTPRGKRLDKQVSARVMADVVVEKPDLGIRCPTIGEQVVLQNIDGWNKLTRDMAKRIPEIQKLIKIQTTDIIESLDPKNIGKSKEVLVMNPDFDKKNARTDSDEDPCVGDNPFWMRSWESVYDRNRYKENTVTSAIKLHMDTNGAVVKEYKDAIKKFNDKADELSKKLAEVNEDLDDVSNNKHQPKNDSLLGDEWFN